MDDVQIARLDAAFLPPSLLPCRTMLASLRARVGHALGLKMVDDLRTLAFTAAYFVLVVSLWFTWKPMAATLAAHGVVGSLPWIALYVCGWLWLCHFSFLAAVATHNSIHCPMFRWKAANKAFQVVLTLAYGHPVTSYVPGHNLSHHKYTQQRKDVMRTTKVRYSWHLLNGLVFFWKIGVDMIANDAGYFALQRKMNRPIVRQLELEQYILWAITASLVLWDWKRWIVLCFLPHMWAKFCIVSLNLLQHDGCDADSRHNFSRNFTGRWLNFFCYNNGYHTIRTDTTASSACMLEGRANCPCSLRSLAHSRAVARLCVLVVRSSSPRHALERASRSPPEGHG